MGIENVKNFLTVKTWDLKLLKLRLLIETLSKIEAFKTVQDFSIVEALVMQLWRISQLRDLGFETVKIETLDQDLVKN